MRTEAEIVDALCVSPLNALRRSANRDQVAALVAEAVQIGVTQQAAKTEEAIEVAKQFRAALTTLQGQFDQLQSQFERMTLVAKDSIGIAERSLGRQSPAAPCLENRQGTAGPRVSADQ